MITRRTLLAAIPAITAAAVIVPRLSLAALLNGASYAKPVFKVPVNACDCHVHVFDPARFPYAESRTYTPDSSPLSALGHHLTQLQMDRVVLVQPSPYGDDNRCMLDALKQLGTQRARAVAVFSLPIAEEQLKEMHELGVRGVRLNLEVYGKARPEEVAVHLREYAELVKPFGWHIQMYTNLATIKDLASVIKDLPVPVVFDHFGHLAASGGLHQDGYEQMLKLVRGGNVYVKLSALYRVSEKHSYEDIEPFVKSLITARPDRLIWASDFPHTMPAPGTKRSKDVIEHFRPEDDGHALNLISQWVSSPSVLNKILVDNPQHLYWS